jgi:hypothetical protein
MALDLTEVRLSLQQFLQTGRAGPHPDIDFTPVIR